MGTETTDKHADGFSALGYTVEENVLWIDGEKWNLIEDHIVENEGGEPKRFEYVLKHYTDNDRQILLATGNNLPENISSFCNQVKGVKATIIGLIIGNSLSVDEKDLARTSGVTLLSSARISYSSGKMKEILKPVITVTNTYQYKDHTRHKAKRRSRTEVVGDILSVLNEEGGMSITKIIYKCNLNYLYAVRILDYLISKRLLLLNDLGNRRIFRITDDGKDLLHKLSTIDL